MGRKIDFELWDLKSLARSKQKLEMVGPVGLEPTTKGL